jgi:signal transduction histidine kinase
MGHDRAMLANPPRARRLGAAIAVLAIVLVLASDSLILLQPASARLTRFWPPTYAVMAIVFVSLFVVIGWLIVSRQPGNGIGWICLASGLIVAANIFLGVYSLVALFDSSATLPGGLWTAWVVQWLWLPQNTLVFVFLPALFPTGHLPSPRWRGLLWLAVLSTAMVIAAAAVYPVMGLWTGGPSCVWSAAIPGPCYQFANPFPVTLPRPFLDSFVRLSGSLSSLAIVLAGAALFARFRTGNTEVRAQLKWLTSAFAVCTTCAAGLFVVGTVLHVTIPVLFIALATALLAVPLSIGFAMLKYHLYDIDVVINRSLVFGTLALFITGVYVGVVAGLGSLIGIGGRPSLALSILATAIVAVAFQPARVRVEQVANRLVYGKRAAPYEILSKFSERVGESYASEEILPTMAQVLAEGTAAARADVWLRIGDKIATAASWPTGYGVKPTSVTVTSDQLPRLADVTRIVPVRHQGELLGALSINKRAGEAMTPVEDDLLQNLAAQAGLVLRNVRLTAELRARVEDISEQAAELRASRQRIVAAQDAERRRLERNIHDGAQQNLVALTVKLRLAANLARRNPERARESARALVVESDQALETLRALAKGIYPPLLRDQGLVAAIRAEVGKLAIPATIHVDLHDRYPSEVEAAVYFVCSEALQNVTRHAHASHVDVNLSGRSHALSFDIADNGAGFDVTNQRQGSGLRNMADRIEAIDGRLEVRSTNRGTTVSGVVPVRAMEPVG